MLFLWMRVSTPPTRKLLFALGCPGRVSLASRYLAGAAAGGNAIRQGGKLQILPPVERKVDNLTIGDHLANL